MKISRYRILLTFFSMAFLVLGILGGLSSGGQAQQSSPYAPDTPREHKANIFAKDNIAIRKQNGEELQFVVELALTPRQLAHGMMYRTSLADDEGMLFIFNEERDAVFWMKNTLIPLDMLFIFADGKIHHIHHNAKPQDMTRIKSDYPSMAVLELAGGAADRLGIREGDTVVYSVFRNAGVQH